MRRNEPSNPTASSSDPFFLIERGNALSSSENHWAASDFFSLASVVLQNRAVAMETALLLNDDDDDNHGDMDGGKETDERLRVAALYRTQSVEYLRKGRRSLVKALELEEEGEAGMESRVDRPPLMELLPEEDRDRRKRIFERTFARGGDDGDGVEVEVEVEGDGGVEDTTESVAEEEVDVPPNPTDAVASSQDPPSPTTIQNDAAASSEEPPRPPVKNDDDAAQKSLEERLALLVSTLPPPPKSNEERLADLGVYVPSSSKTDPGMFKELTKEEQLKEIMGMAKDEADLLLRDGGGGDGGGDGEGVVAPQYDDVEELLRNAGIRIDLPTDTEEEEGGEGVVGTAAGGIEEEERLRDIVADTKDAVAAFDRTNKGGGDGGGDGPKAEPGGEGVGEAGEELTAERLLQKMGIDTDLRPEKEGGEDDGGTDDRGESDNGVDATKDDDDGGKNGGTGTNADHDRTGDRDTPDDEEEATATTPVVPPQTTTPPPPPPPSVSVAATTSQLLSRTQTLLLRASINLSPKGDGGEGDPRTTGDPTRSAVGDARGGGGADATPQTQAALLEEIRKNVDRIAKSYADATGSPSPTDANGGGGGG